MEGEEEGRGERRGGGRGGESEKRRNEILNGMLQIHMYMYTCPTPPPTHTYTLPLTPAGSSWLQCVLNTGIDTL